MIVTVTMNPAVDKTVEVDTLQCGELNRLENVISDAGGKGINVSKTISALGGLSLATGFIGGSSGMGIERVLDTMDINCDFVHINGQTRTNLKVVEKSGRVTELNEPGPEIKPEDMQNLVDKLESHAKEDTLFVFAGSVPNSVDKSIYKTLIEKVKAKGSKVFLDADGQLFTEALKAQPNIIKPNRFELETLYKLDHKASENELIDMGKKLLDSGIELVAISLGKEGALFLTKDRVVKCDALKVEAHSTVGAGDAMVAALAYSINNNMDFDYCIKLGIATSAGAVTTKGTKPPTLELVEKLKQQVVIQNL